MENYKQRLTEQKESLEKDAKAIDSQVLDHENALDDLKEKKRDISKELRFIEKKLEKLTVK